MVSFTSGDYVDTIANLTKKYPNQKMITAGSKPYKNTVNITPRAYEGYYLGGLACASVTKTNKIGYMGLNPTSNTFGIVNSIYAGLKKINPDADLYIAFTNDFYNPLLEKRTAQFMVEEYGIDCAISQSIDANTMWANEKQIPVMGFITDMRYYVGENIMFSVTYQWDYFYYTLTQNVLAGNFTGNRTIFSGFDRIMVLTDFSTTTDNSLATFISQQKAGVANGSISIFCGEMANFFPRTSNASCLNANEIRAMNKFYSSVLNPRNLTMDDIIERLYIEPDSDLGIAIYVINSVIVVLAIMLVGYVLHNKNAGIIRSSAYRFCVLVLCGVVIGAVSSFFWVGYPTDEICMVRVWLGGIAFSISYGGLIIKNFRLWRIFKDKSLETKAASDSELILKGILPVLAAEVVILVLWTTIDPMKVVIVEESPFLSEAQVYVSCRSTSIWPVVVYLVTKGLLLIFGVVVYYNTRDLEKKYNESKEIGWSIYNTVLFGFLAVLANLMVDYNVMLEGAVVTIAIFVICASVIGFVFAPKFWRVTIKGMNGPNIRPSFLSQSSKDTALPTFNTASRTVSQMVSTNKNSDTSSQEEEDASKSENDV